MAIHPDTASMLEESLQEVLYAAECCVNYRKNPQEWGSQGCLGFPAAILLFSVVDAIGSFHRGDSTLQIPIDGTQKTIDTEGSQHFYILNSRYYSQSLSGEWIKKLYRNYRCPLVHNLSLPPEHWLAIGKSSGPVFGTRTDACAEHHPVVNLLPFLEISKKAVLDFKAVVDSIVPSSQQQGCIQRKTFSG